jgi:hypothetical protein
MWMEKLTSGVLRVLTPLGPRYIAPTFWQRVRLLWIFRNFEVLPLQVLKPWQQQLIDDLCAERRFVSLSTPNMLEDAPVLGTVERRPPVEVERLPERKSAVGEVATPFAADVRQRS